MLNLFSLLSKLFGSVLGTTESRSGYLFVPRNSYCTALKYTLPYGTDIFIYIIYIYIKEIMPEPGKSRIQI